jgi:glycosyltransferase involved in cell wall biosynthesis
VAISEFPLGRMTRLEAMLINVTIPAFNEEAQLAGNVAALHRFLSTHLSHQFEIVIADNASTDRTLEVATRIAREHEHVHVVHLDQKGRGRAVKRVWEQSMAGVLSYMDVDLSTDISAFPTLIDSLIVHGFDLAIGSRLLRPELTSRGWKRELISRCYNWIVKASFQTQFSDAQCGFKAITGAAAKALLPCVLDHGWFFDTELLVLAEKLGYRIFDLPVCWADDPDSRVNLLKTAVDDLKGIIRIKRNIAAGKYLGATKYVNSSVQSASRRG